MTINGIGRIVRVICAVILLAHYEFVTQADPLMPPQGQGDFSMSDDAAQHLAFCAGAPADDEGGVAYEFTQRWPGDAGSPLSLSWSIVPDGVMIPGGSGEASSPSNLFATLDAQFAGLGGRAAWIELVERSFDRWSAVSGVNFVHVQAPGSDADDGAAWGAPAAPNARGDIRIAMHPIQTAGGSGIWVQTPQGGGDICLDSDEGYDASGADYRFMRNLIMHAAGHSIGLAHSCPRNGTKLMEGALGSAFDGPRHDDVRGAQWLYGDAFEPNESFMSATDLGELQPGQAIVDFGAIANPAVANSSRLSIRDADLDWFQFGTEAALRATITITPRGLMYDQSSESPPAGCDNGHFNNSVDEANLRVDWVDSDGESVLASADQTPAGQPETLRAVRLAAHTTYYLKVSAVGTAAQPQMYVISMTDCAASAIGDANCDGLVNNFDIDAFVLGIAQGNSEWSAEFTCDFLCALDIDGDGVVNNFDIDPFVECLTLGACP